MERAGRARPDSEALGPRTLLSGAPHLKAVPPHLCSPGTLRPAVTGHSPDLEAGHLRYRVAGPLHDYDGPSLQRLPPPPGPGPPTLFLPWTSQSIFQESSLSPAPCCPLPGPGPRPPRLPCSQGPLHTLRARPRPARCRARVTTPKGPRSALTRSLQPHLPPSPVLIPLKPQASFLSVPQDPHTCSSWAPEAPDPTVALQGALCSAWLMCTPFPNMWNCPPSNSGLGLGSVLCPSPNPQRGGGPRGTGVLRVSGAPRMRVGHRPHEVLLRVWSKGDRLTARLAGDGDALVQGGAPQCQGSLA